jgi:hypothetical protein
MASDCGFGDGGTDGRPNLRLEPGETVTLSPDSQRYARFYKQYHPTTLDELKTLIGVAVDSGATVVQGRCCPPESLAAVVMMPDELMSDDPVARTKADRLTYLATREYLSGAGAGLQAWEPTISAWIRIKKPVLNIVSLFDIEIADKATLDLSPNTHGLYAHAIVIHGSGRINCHGPTKIKATSLEGRRRGVLGGIANPLISTRVITGGSNA